MMSSVFNFVIDPKNRVFVPAKFREELGVSFMIHVDFRDNCLTIRTNEDYDEYIKRITEGLNAADSSKVLRRFGKYAVQAVPDTQGRVLLTKMMLERCGITKDVTIVGCGNYAEIWPSEAYDEFEENLSDEAYLQIVEKIGL